MNICDTIPTASLHFDFSPNASSFIWFLSKGKDDGRGEKILAAVIQMAKALDMPVIAEGVEEKKQVQMLKRLGCNYIQGYYFAKPMPQEDYERLARKSHE